MLERRNDYVQARGCYCTIEDWEREDLVANFVDLLGQCERDVQTRMIWHLLLVHDDLGGKAGTGIGVTAADVSSVDPLPGQVLTDDDQRRLKSLGRNGDALDASAWGTWTGSVAAPVGASLRGTIVGWFRTSGASSTPSARSSRFSTMDGYRPTSVRRSAAPPLRLSRGRRRLPRPHLRIARSSCSVCCSATAGCSIS